MAQTPPTPDEIKTLDEEARQSHVRISTDKGDMVLAFFPDDAPTHVAAFLKLAKSGFSATRALSNIGHNPWRMTFVARHAF